MIKARILVHIGALSAMRNIMKHLGYPTTALDNTSPPGNEFASLVDYAICADINQDKKILLEIKSPSVLEYNLPTLEGPGFRVLLESDGPTNARAINNVRFRCLTSLSNLIIRGTSLSYRVHEFT